MRTITSYLRPHMSRSMLDRLGLVVAAAGIMLLVTRATAADAIGPRSDTTAGAATGARGPATNDARAQRGATAGGVTGADGTAEAGATAKPAAPPQPVAKLPAPSEEDQAAASKTIRAVYEAEYASKKPDEIIALSDKLLEAAGQDGVTPVEKYVLLRDAGTLAAGAGDGARAVGAADALASAFHVKSLALKLSLVQAAARATGIREAERSMGTAEAALNLADDAVAMGDFDSAMRCATVADAVAKHVGDAQFSAFVAGRAGEVRRVRGEYAKLEPVFERLRHDSDDAAANLKVGRFHCLSVGHWDKGLPHLAKGTDVTLKALAEKERAGPQDVAARVDLADGWWEVAKREPGPTGARAKAHAADWYRRAATDAKGVMLAKVKQRLAQAGPEEVVAKGRTLNLLKGVKLSRDVVEGKWQYVRGGLQSDQALFSRIAFQYEPPEEYDVTVEFTIVRGHGTGAVILPRANKLGRHAFGMFGPFAGLQPNPAVEGPCFKRVQKPLRAGERVRMQLKVRKERVTGYANGSMIFDENIGLLDAGSTGLYPLPTQEQMGMVSDVTVVTFHRVEVREISGPGKNVKTGG